MSLEDIRTEEDDEPEPKRPDMMAELRAIRKATERTARMVSVPVYVAAIGAVTYVVRRLLGW